MNVLIFRGRTLANTAGGLVLVILAIGVPLGATAGQAATATLLTSQTALTDEARVVRQGIRVGVGFTATVDAEQCDNCGQRGGRSIDDEGNVSTDS